MSSSLSQSEARRWRKRALAAEATLRQQKRDWADSWPNGTSLCGINIANSQDDLRSIGQIIGARKLRHAVVVTVSDDRMRLIFHALQLP
jgi:hypothetical protein